MAVSVLEGIWEKHYAQDAKGEMREYLVPAWTSWKPQCPAHMGGFRCQRRRWHFGAHSAFGFSCGDLYNEMVWEDQRA